MIVLVVKVSNLLLVFEDQAEYSTTFSMGPNGELLAYPSHPYHKSISSSTSLFLSVCRACSDTLR